MERRDNMQAIIAALLGLAFVIFCLWATGGVNILKWMLGIQTVVFIVAILNAVFWKL